MSTRRSTAPSFVSDASDAQLSISASDEPRDGGGSHFVAASVAISQPPVYPGTRPRIRDRRVNRRGIRRRSARRLRLYLPSSQLLANLLRRRSSSIRRPSRAAEGISFLSDGRRTSDRRAIDDAAGIDRRSHVGGLELANLVGADHHKTTQRTEANRYRAVEVDAILPWTQITITTKSSPEASTFEESHRRHRGRYRHPVGRLHALVAPCRVVALDVLGDDARLAVVRPVAGDRFCRSSP